MTLPTAALLALLASAVPPAGGLAEDGAVAAAGSWTTSGGCAARTARTTAAPLRARPEPAWSLRVEGEIAAEPLVTRRHVILESARDDGSRALTLLRLRDGTRVGEPTRFETALPLAPGVDGRIVVVRAGRGRLQALRIGSSGLEPIWNRTGDATFGPPLLFRSELYVVEGNALVRLSLTRLSPVWRREGRFRGRPSLRGDSVYAARFDGHGGGGGRVYALARASGAATELFDFPGEDGSRVPAPADDLRLSVFADRVVLHRPPFAETENPAFSRAVFFGPRHPRPVYDRVARRFVGQAAEIDAGWIAFVDDSEVGRFLAAPDPAEPGFLTVLATRDTHDVFLRSPRSPSVAGDVVFVGARAFDARTGRVQFALDRPTRFRAVPVERTLLVVDGASRVTALRPPSPPAGEAWLVPPPAMPAEGVAVLDRASAVFRDGQILTGRFEVRFEERVVVPEGGAPRPFASLLLLEDHTRWPIYAASTDDLAEALDRLDARDRTEAVADLARRAVVTNDVALLEELYFSARALGVSEERLEPVAKRLAYLEAHRRPVRERNVAEIRGRLAELARAPAERAFERARTIALAGDTAPLRLLLRRTLEHDPSHAGAVELVRSLLPSGWSSAAPRGPAGREPFDALDWLDFLEATRSTPVTVIDGEPRGTGDPDPDDRAPGILARARRDWRRDLAGFRSRHLLVVTPVTQRPGAIARCLSQGELVCDALSEIFSVPTRRDIEREPLVLYLYESRAEYLARSQGGPGDESHGHGLQGTAGYYDQRANRSHVFLPPAEEGAFERLAATYSHELVHHWVRAHLPRLPGGTASHPRPGTPGYWIVEGLATFVQELDFDLDRRTWSVAPARAESLGFVRHAAPSELLPWPEILELSWLDYRGLSHEETLQVPAPGYLGRLRPTSPLRAFYLQSSAACHALWHADRGRHREALVRYLVRHYTRKTVPDDLEAIFGMDAAAIGRRVVEHARSAALPR